MEAARKSAASGQKDKAAQALSQAEEIAGRIADAATKEMRDDAVRWGELDIALQVISAIPDAPYKIAALRHVAAKYAAANQKAKAADVLFQAQQATGAIAGARDQQQKPGFFKKPGFYI